jgi:uncharacterized membrane protein
MTFLATILAGAPGWTVPAMMVLAAALSLVVWGYARASHGGQARVPAAVAKLLAVAALAACLVEPLWSDTRAKPGANLFVVLADNSQGMTIHDRGAARSRGAELREQLTADPSPWQTRLAQDFEVRRYAFDSRLRSVPDFQSLAFDGRSSSLATALRTIRERFSGRPLAGVLLFSDGIATDVSDELPDAAGLPPVFAVVCGEADPPRDLGITNVQVSQTAFEDAPVTIRVDVRAAGFARRQVVAQALDESGQKVTEESQQVQNDPQTIAFRLQLRPAKTGVSFYTVRVSDRRELDQFDRPEQSSEATLANNRRLVVVERGAGPYHVLYVAGRPNWEFKFLRRAIEEDQQVRLVGMIRVAKREPKFVFQSKRGQSNPLFSGFRDPADDTERYDEPVLVRLNTLDDAELRDGFPKTREQLYAYHAVVIDDLEAEFFAPDQMALLRRFVSERGGGFLMLGGQESFGQGKYQRTPIEELLPVYLDHAPAARPDEKLRLELTRDGWLQPWVRLRKNESDEQTRVEQMPEFMTVNRVRGVKPGASELAFVTDTQKSRFPALVAQRFGRGRSAAQLVGDFWRWALRQDPEDRDLEKAWRQTVRWLVSDVPERVEARSEFDRESSGELVRLVTRVRSPLFEPLDNASVRVSIRTPGGEEMKLDAEASGAEPGAYEIAFSPRHEGAYLAKIEVTDESGTAVGTCETGWTSDPAADEFQSLIPNRRLLEHLARSTGGELLTLEQLPSFAASLPTRKAPIIEQWASPLWHRTSVFLLAIACLVTEWGLRRWRGLP